MPEEGVRFVGMVLIVRKPGGTGAKAMGIDAEPSKQPFRPPFRIGHGYDLHRLAPVGHRPPGNSGGIPWGGDGMGRPFILGGVRVDHPTGPVGHSDGDALYHAVTDALLGALALPDIGQLFPDTDPRSSGPLKIT